MNNRLIDNSNKLSYINYEKVLNEIENKINEIDIGNKDGNIYLKNLHKISSEITDNLLSSNRKISDIIEIDSNKKISTISINHKDEIDFRKNISGIDKKITEKLESDLFLSQNECFQSLKDYKQNIKSVNVNFGLNYDFNDSKLVRNRISTKKVISKERLRVDEVQISIDTLNIEENLKSSLKKHIDDNSLIDEYLKEDLFEEIENNNLKINNIIKILDSEVLARIKRSVSNIYLQYLCENTENIYLKDYLRRFKLLEDFLIELSKQAQNNSMILDYDITNILSKGNAFDELPIKGIVEGNIFEDKSEKTKLSKFALKLKLNGQVNKDGSDNNNSNKNSKSCYKYYTDLLIDDESKMHKRVKIFTLYMFMLKDLGNLNYNPIKDFKNTKVYIENNSYETPTNKFKKICKRLVEVLDNSENKISTTNKLNEMKYELDKIIKYKANSLKVSDKNYLLNLVLHKDIIDNSTLEHMEIFKSQEYDVQYLKYISISEKEEEFSDRLISTNIQIKIKSYNLYETDDYKETNSSYKIDNFKSVPIVMYPASLKDGNKKYRNKFYKLVNNTIYNKNCIYLATLQDEDILEKEANHYLYRLIYQTLSYMVIENILKIVEVENKKEIFIPIIRYHDKNENKKVSKCDKFIREYSKVLAHLLSKQYRSSSQGFDISKKNPTYSYKNAMSSLYSKIPRQFEEFDIGNIDKMAMIVVTSKKCDNSYEADESISTLFGDVVLFDKENNKVICDLYSSFSDNYRSCDLYEKPMILRDVVSSLYENGYKNILYIAKAPYTSTLNITKKEDLFFMDEKVIKLLRGEKNDLIIYPLYYDNFYAIDYKQNATTQALYIEDTYELDSIINSNSKSTASVFNLYSGKSIGKNNNDKRYRSVILYQTLYNLYENKILNIKINEGLIANSKIKNSIMNFITMYHYARYEGSSNISIKMNPYSNLMSDDGVSGLSTKEFELAKYKKIKSNMLAYLTEVKKSMDGDL